MGAKHDVYLAKYKEQTNTTIEKIKANITKQEKSLAVRNELYPKLKQKALDLGVGDMFTRKYPAIGLDNASLDSTLISALYTTGDADFTEMLKSYYKVRSAETKLSDLKYRLAEVVKTLETGGDPTLSLLKEGLGNIIISQAQTSGKTIDDIFDDFVKSADIDEFEDLISMISFKDPNKTNIWDNRLDGITSSVEAQNAIIEAKEEGTFNLGKSPSSSNKSVNALNEPTEPQISEEIAPINEPTSTEATSPTDSSKVESNTLELEKEKTLNTGESTLKTEQAAPAINEPVLNAPLIQDGGNISNTLINESINQTSSPSNVSSESSINNVSNSIDIADAPVSEISEGDILNQTSTESRIDVINNLINSVSSSVNEDVTNDTANPTETSINNTTANPTETSINNATSNPTETLIEKTSSSEVINPIDNATRVDEKSGDPINTLMRLLGSSDMLSELYQTGPVASSDSITSSELSINESNNNVESSNESINTSSSDSEVVKSDIAIDKKTAPLSPPKIPIATPSVTPEQVSVDNSINKESSAVSAQSNASELVSSESNSQTNTSETAENKGAAPDLSEISNRLKRIENVLSGTLDVKIVE